MQEERIRWAPKVRRELIKQVYTKEAQGILDDALLDDLGIRLLLRCESMLRAMRGQVQCPRCQKVFVVDETAARSTDGVAACPTGCGWKTTPADYRQRRRKRHLTGADKLVPLIQRFVDRYPSCRSTREKMLAVDRLIHEFHWDWQTNLPNRSVGNNLIEGSHREVVQFLDDLSALDPGRKQQWSENVEIMWKRRRGQLGREQ